jgi:hypothetical protein
VQHADSLLSSPPKKRSNATMNNSSKSAPAAVMPTGNLSYSGVVRAQTTHTRSVASQTVMAVMETRFQSIEEEQQSLKHRLSNVETRTVTTDENIRAMMARWKITPAPIKRKFIDDQEYDENSSAAGNAILLASSEQGQGANCF